MNTRSTLGSPLLPLLLMLLTALSLPAIAQAQQPPTDADQTTATDDGKKEAGSEEEEPDCE